MAADTDNEIVLPKAASSYAQLHSCRSLFLLTPASVLTITKVSCADPPNGVIDEHTDMNMVDCNWKVVKGTKPKVHVHHGEPPRPTPDQVKSMVHGLPA
jgi:hypothetical protein